MATDAKDRKQEILEQAGEHDIEIEDQGGGWYVVEGEKVRGLDAVEEQIATILEASDLPWYGLPCLCGCGGETKPKSKYLQGHDAKLRSHVMTALKEEEDPYEGLPEYVHPFLEEEAETLLRPYEWAETAAREQGLI